MAELPELVKDLALILVVAGTVTLLFKRLKQPLVLGYIVAGFIVSPQMPYTMSVIDRADVQTWADIVYGICGLTMNPATIYPSTGGCLSRLNSKVTVPATTRISAKSFTNSGNSAIFPL